MNDKEQLLEERIGYTFKRKNLLKAALSHNSLRFNAKIFGKKKDCFERLEFLGDRVLGLIISEFIYEHFPKEKEGPLAKRLAFLVCKERCLDVAHDIQLLSYMSGLDQDLSGRSSSLADGIESLIGAIYLDAGLEPAKEFVMRYWSQFFQEKNTLKDAKTILQEWCQKNQRCLPVYKVVAAQGPHHCPTFGVTVTIEKEEEICAHGNNKKEGEQNAAKLFLKKKGIFV